MAARVRFELVEPLTDGTKHVDALASRTTITAGVGITVTAEPALTETTSDYYPITSVRTIRYYDGEIRAENNQRRDDPVPEV
jgi:hypothetical protein